MRTRRTLRGHLAKIYAMHWGTDSRWVQGSFSISEGSAALDSVCVCVFHPITYVYMHISSTRDPINDNIYGPDLSYLGHCLT